MQKKIIALAVAGLSTAAIAQTNVTIYGVADVSGQGYNMSSKNARAATSGNVGNAASGGAFTMNSNSSLIGFKGTENLGNGLNALFQIESNIGLTGAAAGTGASLSGTTSASGWGELRDTYAGLNSKYGTVLGGYLSTPFRSALTSFDVMPGATGSGRIESLMGQMRYNSNNLGSANVQTGGLAAVSSVRATALAYAMPTLYGFNGSLAYTGSNNNGNGNQQTGVTAAPTTITSATPQGALSMNLGWAGYGVDIKGSYQQAKVNQSATGIGNNLYLQGLTSYLVGAAYTGLPGLKASVVYVRNSLGTNGVTGGVGAQKGSNNQVYVGASYRFGNNEPRLSYQTSGNTSGLNNVGQDGGSQWTANWGYYLSKRTQVYGIVSALKNNANGVWAPVNNTAVLPTGGQNIVTYGAGLRTNF